MNEKILVVDDEKEIADLLEVYLKNDNYIVHKYYNCKLRSNGMPVPLLRNCYSIFNGTKYR